MKKLASIILAAGKGTRMKSSLPKVLHEVGGLPMVQYPLEIMLGMKANPVVMVIGHSADLVKERFKDFNKLEFAKQEKQLGSAHAVLAAHKALKGFEGDVVILSGDVPLVSQVSVERLLRFHHENQNALSLASFRLKKPTGYGRVIRDLSGGVIKIVEESDLSIEEKTVEEVNGGLYIAKAPLLFKALEKIKPNPIKNEYYFTDLPQIFHQMGYGVGALLIEDYSELSGVNSRLDLANAEQVLQSRLREKWMMEGVTFLHAPSTFLHAKVEIGQDSILHPGAELRGSTHLGKACVVESGAIIIDSQIADQVTIRAYSHLEKCKIETGAIVGPFARIRPESVIRKNAHVGNFVELKKTSLGEGSKANHLSYLGDAHIGNQVNIGAGTITCNYDGVNKFQTQIESGVFIGSDTQLVAPVKIGKGAYIGAGSTITKNVPAEALALTRVEQTHIAGYSKKKKRK